jgi:hypothetical protein
VSLTIQPVSPLVVALVAHIPRRLSTARGTTWSGIATATVTPIWRHAQMLPRPDDDGAPSGRRLLGAFLIAPLTAPAAYAAFLVAMMLARVALGSASSSSLGGIGELVLAVAALGVPLAYGAAFLAGAPIYFVLRHRGVVAPQTLWIVGAMIGAAVALLLAPRLRGDPISIRFPWWAGSLLGVLSADVFRRFLSTRGTE